MAPSPGQTLDPRILSAIGDLELVARVTIDGTVSGLHRSPFHGYSAEFSQYRHYRPGDDLKYVDWKLFARTDRFYTKQYRETTNMTAELAVDASASMAYRGASGVSKLEYARLVGAALVYLLIARQGDAAGLVAYDSEVRQYIPSRSGRLHLRRLLVALSALKPAGATAAAAALRRAVDLLRRRGALFVISDLYDEDDPVSQELTRAVRMGHEVAVFHVLTREELEFPFRSDIEFEDLETGRTVLASPAAVRVAYRRSVAAFVERWRMRCAALGIDYTLLTTDMPLDAAMRRYLLGRTAGRSAR
jgi:uncharacterized protein (DUF58 family)